MPIYKKIGNKWQLVASSYDSPDPSLYHNINGNWKPSRSGWIKEGGKWHQFYQKNPIWKNRTRCFVFLGDSIANGSGLSDSQNFTRIIQQHLKYANKTYDYNICRSSISDHYNNGLVNYSKFTKSSGVYFEDSGIFSGFKGSTSAPSRIVIPSGQSISFYTNFYSGSRFNICASGEFKAYITGFSTNSGETTLLNNIDYTTSASSKFIDFYTDLYKNINYVYIQPYEGTMYINAIHNSTSITTVGEEVVNGVVQVMARDSYAIEDYLGKEEDIKNGILYKKYYDDAGNSNAPPVVIIQAGIVDMVDRKIPADKYLSNLQQLAANLLESTNTITDVNVVLTVPFNLLNYTVPTEYIDAIKIVANNLNLDCVDLNVLNMEKTDFQSDGINPSYNGSLKIANKYIEDLGLSTFLKNTDSEYLLGSIRGTIVK